MEVVTRRVSGGNCFENRDGGEVGDLLDVGGKEARADPRGLQGLPYRTAQLLRKEDS
jgi:hypothetical protein